MSDRLATAVLGPTVELERDVNAGGWDRGVGVWEMHLHTDGDITPVKLGGPEFVDQDPRFVIGHIRDLDDCAVGVALSFEVWIDVEHTQDMRILTVVTRDGGVVSIARERTSSKPNMAVGSTGSMRWASVPLLHQIIVLLGGLCSFANLPPDQKAMTHALIESFIRNMP